jgi:thymidylate synthase
MRLNPEVRDLFSFQFDDFELVGYEAAPHIRAQVSK